MGNQTLPARAIRRVWSQLPPPARRRLTAQLVFLLRAGSTGAVSEPICDSARPFQPARCGVRAAIDSTPSGAPSGEPAPSIPADGSGQSIWLAGSALPDNRRRPGHLGRPEQQSTGVSAAGFDGRAA